MITTGVVAPFAGAWIEITFLGCFIARERGLKYIFIYGFSVVYMSLPSRERGLKYRLYLIIHLRVKSLPSRERGLKSARPMRSLQFLRRSLRGSVD